MTAQESGRTVGAGAGEGAEAEGAAAAGAAFADARSSSDSKHATRLFLGVIVKASGVLPGGGGFKREIWSVEVRVEKEKESKERGVVNKVPFCWRPKKLE